MSKNEAKLQIDEILTKVKALCYNKLDKGSYETVTKLLNDSFVEVVLDKPKNLGTLGFIDKSQAMFDIGDDQCIPLFSEEISEENNEN
jgi:hypothetical protein